MDNLFEDKLSMRERKGLPDDMYGLPDEKKFPIHDKVHVTKAIQFFKCCPQKKQHILADNIIKRIGELNMRPNVHEDNPFYDFYKKANKDKEDDTTKDSSIANMEPIVGSTKLHYTDLEGPFRKTHLDESSTEKEILDELTECLDFIGLKKCWEEYNNIKIINDDVTIIYGILYDSIKTLIGHVNERFIDCEDTIKTLISILSMNHIDIDVEYLFILKRWLIYHIMSHNIKMTDLIPSLVHKIDEKIDNQYYGGGEVDKSKLITALKNCNAIDFKNVEHILLSIAEKNSEIINKFQQYIIDEYPSSNTEDEDIEASDIDDSVFDEIFEELSTLDLDLENSKFVAEALSELSDGNIKIANIDGKTIVKTVDDDVMIPAKDKKDITKNYVIGYNNNKEIELNEIKLDSLPVDSDKLTEGISIEPDGSVRFTIKPRKSYMDEYAEAHRLITSNAKIKNYAAVKDNLCFLFSLIATIERDVLYSKKKFSKDAYKDAQDARALAINDFKRYMREVQKVDKDFNFAKYYEDSNYGKLVFNVTPDAIKGIKRLFELILLA